MKLKKLSNGKSSAQAMVEFAIALPILLMLLYGILEAGRLLFLYSTVVTASRQAVRYGSATGVGTGGAIRYRDCEGMRLAANRVDYLNAFDHTGSDIVINYDSGPGTPLLPFSPCDGSVDTGVIPTTNNKTRIVVTILGDYLPAVPRLVSFAQRTVANGNPIEAVSARTILVSVSIVVTAPPGTWTPSTATNTSTPSPTPSETPTRTPTRTPSPTPLLTNTPSMTLTSSVTPLPTTTFTPSLTSTSPVTPVSNCTITPGTITKTGNTMLLTLTSSVASSVTIQDIFVVWNHDKGHQTGGDKTLKLNSISLGSQIWSGTSNGPSATITPSGTATIPPGTSTLIFTFHQSYDNFDNPATEEILINLSSPGCTGSPIHVTRP